MEWVTNNIELISAIVVAILGILSVYAKKHHDTALRAVALLHEVCHAIEKVEEKGGTVTGVKMEVAKKHASLEEVAPKAAKLLSNVIAVIDEKEENKEPQRC
jgi:hypothetical protein